MRLPPRPRAVVTGAGSGLGRALALALAHRGGRVLVTDVALPGAEETARLVIAAGGEAHPLACDVRRVVDLERAAAEAEARWGGVDLVVNNAGVAAAGAVGDVPLADWDWLLAINLGGVVNGCHVFAPRLKAQGRGAILNVASAAGFACLPEMAPYNVAKAGVIALSETLAAELSPHGVTVTVLCPTFFASALLGSLRSPTERHRRLARAWFARARTTADGVARAGLRGIERGRLVVVPQADGRLVWRLKRWFPGLYARVVRWQYRSGWGERAVLRALPPEERAGDGVGNAVTEREPREDRVGHAPTKRERSR